MKGDFSRLTFDPSKRFRRVLMQQGRVQLDADWNEQAAILLYYLERLTADLIGPHGGPEGQEGFAIGVCAEGTTITDLTLGTGRYYVDGLLCENLDANATYFAQPDLPRDRSQDKLPTTSFLAYLDVWERHLTNIEDDSIREVALQGPDTATRARLVWQVRVTDQAPADKTPFPATANDATGKMWRDWVEVWQPANRGCLKARAKLGGDPTKPCVASPDTGFRGLENQLYRVEIHSGGKAAEGGATFKWSRDNGSVAFPIIDLTTESGSSDIMLTLEHLGSDGRASLAPDDWVEIVDDDVALGQRQGALAQVATVDAERTQVTLRKPHSSKVGQDKTRHPLLRRWDYGSAAVQPAANGALAIVEGTDEGAWLDLEDGIQVCFQPAKAGASHTYCSGDYWLIPARTATGSIEWPGKPDDPTALQPHGVRHHYAPLALLVCGEATSLRKSFKPQATEPGWLSRELESVEVASQDLLRRKARHLDRLLARIKHALGDSAGGG
ncbi:MAG TPA: DUF6519 domain-containing protein [Thermoanaerobaculia bacterium]|nr:DUF6519 domain-containing protein [Thermoanaerobaculia bacterium]